MTEEEAKGKWCPKYQVATSGGDSSTFESDNRPAEHEKDAAGCWRPTGRIHETARCLGSACMAWRWREPPGPQPPDAPEPSNEGWCGLAGKP